ncbi:hypothetical protein NQ317_013286 [Molorchus minor]|uniref:Uncharacterized protein n=1 Tax=Molorchus minor TaxID=1323400 RepID=A0ABQ9JQX2_9CUCU|nr:hypothetical protein NQ317_013286 [Molorchus minor]
MEKPDNLTRENIKRVNILGWCMEMLSKENAPRKLINIVENHSPQSFDKEERGLLNKVMQSCLIIDDIVDNSEFRRKAPSWYKQEGVGNLAIYDALILDGFSHVLLKKYFSSHPYYVQMVDLLTTTRYWTARGLNSKKNTMERFIKTARYKTGFYKIWCPVTLGLYFSKEFNEELHEQITPALLEMGIYSQIQDLEMVIKCLICKAPFKKGENRSFHRKRKWLSAIGKDRLYRQVSTCRNLQESSCKNQAHRHNSKKI